MTTHRLRKAAWLAPVAVAVALPVAASAAVPGAGHGFGGITNQSIFHRGDGGAVELRINKDGRKVARATATLQLKCTSGDSFVVPDRYRNMPIARNRSFSASFGPETEPDGSVLSGSISGSFNAARTAASGTWSLKEVFKDTTGATTDTCKTGKVKWSVKR